MIKNIYVCVDKVSGNTLIMQHFANDATAIREILPTVWKVYPLEDVEVRCIGQYDDETTSIVVDGDLDAYKYRVVSWDNYKYPENKAQNLAPLGASAQEMAQAFDKANEEINNR